jgi:hypothetical protein
MKCSLSDIESLSAEIENLGTLGPEQLDQAWRDLFESDRPRRVCGDLLIKALGYRLQDPLVRRAIGWGRPPIFVADLPTGPDCAYSYLGGGAIGTRQTAAVVKCRSLSDFVGVSCRSRRCREGRVSRAAAEFLRKVEAFKQEPTAIRRNPTALAEFPLWL